MKMLRVNPTRIKLIFNPESSKLGRAYLIVQIIISFSTFVENIENNL